MLLFIVNIYDYDLSIQIFNSSTCLKFKLTIIFIMIIVKFALLI